MWSDTCQNSSVHEEIFQVEIKNQKSVLTDMKNKKILNDVCSTGTIFFSQKVGDILLTLLGFLFLGMWFYVIVLSELI